jgi:hemoglobin
MCDFWSSVLLMTGRFEGDPMGKHVAVGGIRPTHFARWLHLFRQTVEKLCPTPAAEMFVMRSEMIARSLQRGIEVLTPRAPEASAP